jgi:hypothetical protein
VQPPTTATVVEAETVPAGARPQASTNGEGTGVLAVSQRPVRELASDRAVVAPPVPVVYQLSSPGLPSLAQLGDISLWAYGALILLCIVVGLGAWAMHLRGARW